jgi:hypothetical protein
MSRCTSDLPTPLERETRAVEVAGQSLGEAIEAGQLKFEVLATLPTRGTRRMWT